MVPPYGILPWQWILTAVVRTIGDKHQLFVNFIHNHIEKGMVAAGVNSKFESPLKAVGSFINNSGNTIISGNNCMAIQTILNLPPVMLKSRL